MQRTSVSPIKPRNSPPNVMAPFALPKKFPQSHISSVFPPHGPSTMCSTHPYFYHITKTPCMALTSLDPHLTLSRAQKNTRSNTWSTIDVTEGLEPSSTL